MPPQTARGKRAILWIVVLLSFLLAPLSRAQGPQAPPNLVFFLVDDLGWQDLSEPFHAERTPFNERYRTPHVERLARSGVKFTQAYAHCVCSPTRVSLLTGMNPARHGVTNWILRSTGPPGGRRPDLVLPDWNHNGITDDPATPHAVFTETLPGLLHRAGYRTIHVGKAHWGAIGTPGSDPRRLGWDVNVAGHAAGGPSSYLGTDNFHRQSAADVWAVPGLQPYHGKDVFLTEALTQEAIREIDRALQDGERFFLHLSHYAVHAPLMPDRRFTARYEEMGLHPREVLYAAMVEGVDHSLGAVLDHLEARGIADETVVVFYSDNGGLSAHARGGEPHTHNRPLASGKGSALEGGVRVPLIVRWPGVTEPGSRSDALVIAEDMFPTLLAIADVEAPPGERDGRSFVPQLRGAPGAARSLIWHYPHVWGARGPGIGPYSAIRRGDWKLIYSHGSGSCSLFDLRRDLGERHDLSAHRPDRVAELGAELKAYLRRVNAPWPRDAITGQPIPMPGS